MSLRVAARLAAEGIGARVFDLRWLAPLPAAELLAEAERTGRVLVVDETRRSGGVSEGVIAALADAGFAGRVGRVAAADSYVPLGDAANLVLVSEPEIEAAARRLLASVRQAHGRACRRGRRRREAIMRVMADDLLFVYSSPGPVDLAEFNDWYDNEHVPNRLALPGFGAVNRYRASDGMKPEWLATYEVKPGTLDGEDYKALWANASPREKQIMSTLTTLDRRLYTLLSDVVGGRVLRGVRPRPRCDGGVDVGAARGGARA